MTAITAGPAPRSAGWFSQTWRILLRWVVATARQPWGVVASLFQPVVWILLFGQVYASLGGGGAFGEGGYLGYLVPGMLMMTVLYSGAWAGAAHLDDIRTGVMDAMLASPVRRSALVVGQLAQQLLVNLVQSGLVLGIGAIGGARYPGGFVGILGALGAATLLAGAFCGLSVAVALLTRSQVALIGIAQLVVLPVTFLSTAMMPAALLPDWVRAIAMWNPMTWAVEAARTGLAGAGDAALAWGRAGLLAVLAALALTWAIRALGAYRRRL